MTISREAKTFNAMLALLQAAGAYKDHLIDSKAVAYSTKESLKRAFKGIELFNQQIRLSMPDNDREIWLAERRTDALVYSAIFEMLAEMNEEGRAKLEQAATEILKEHRI